MMPTYRRFCSILRNVCALIFRPRRAQPERGNVGENFLLRETSSGEIVECAPDQRRTLRVSDQAASGRPMSILVTKGCEECPPSELESCAHPAAGSLGTHVIVELREGS